jgi:hypothetical protein
MPRYSLTRLLALIAVVAAFCAALANPSPAWAQAAVTLLIFVLLVATVAAMFSRGQTRAFAGGMVVLGTAFFALFFLINPPARPMNWLDSLVDMLRYAVLGSYQPVDMWDSISDFTPAELAADQEKWRAETRWFAFGTIAYVAITLLMGALGGLIALAFHIRANREKPQSVEQD